MAPAVPELLRGDVCSVRDYNRSSKGVEREMEAEERGCRCRWNFDLPDIKSMKDEVKTVLATSRRRRSADVTCEASIVVEVIGVRWETFS